MSALVLLVGFNLDQAEKRARLARAIVPEESVPCGVAEQYYLDRRLLSLRSAEECVLRRQKMNFWMFAMNRIMEIFESLPREHLLLSFLVLPIPTFTRVKRSILVILELHICMLLAALVYNVREHEAPFGRYDMLSCSGPSRCIATIPLSFLSAVILCPTFRFFFHRQMRLTCLVPQTHPSSSSFPLNVRKFASISPRSTWESCLCMHNSYERYQAKVVQSRTFVHRVVQVIWSASRPSIKDLRFYGMLTSWAIVLADILIIGATVAYVFFYTTYLKDEVVYHWLAWTLSMFFISTLFLEPLLILCIEVIWGAFCESVTQHWGFGAHALASTTKYKDVVRQVDHLFVATLQNIASKRIQRWWLGLVAQFKEYKEKTTAAIKIQSIGKGILHKKKYNKQRKWCMKVEVLECIDLEQVSIYSVMSPVIRLQCESGNPTVLQTKVAQDAGTNAKFNDSFFVDIKESSGMYVSAWSKGLTEEEFIGRGYFEFSQLKGGDKDKTESHVVKVTLHDIQHGQLPASHHSSCGTVKVRITFLDPLKDDCGNDNNSWMLPRHRMQFALSRMGGRMRVGKMLGSLPAGRSSLDLVGLEPPGSANTEFDMDPSNGHVGAPAGPSGINENKENTAKSPPTTRGAPQNPPKFSMRAPSTKAPGTESAMGASSFKAPNIKAPNVQSPPNASAPSMKAPSMKAPSMKAPSMKAPSMKAPSMKAPSTKAPATNPLNMKAPSMGPPQGAVPEPKASGTASAPPPVSLTPGHQITSASSSLPPGQVPFSDSEEDGV